MNTTGLASAALALAVAASPAAAGPPAAPLKVLRPAPPELIRAASDPAALSDPERAVSCPSPCRNTFLQLVTPYYEAVMSCATGGFALRTGAAHSATVATGNLQSLTFGGVAGDTKGGEVRLHLYNNGNDYYNPANGDTCAFDPADTPGERMSKGLEREVTLTVSNNLRLLLREELVLFGASEADAGIRLTLTATNLATSTQTARIGLRWHVDPSHGDDTVWDDGPLLSMLTCTPRVVEAERNTEHEFLPAEIGEFFQLRNNTGPIEITLAADVSPLAAFAGTGIPDRLIYGRWANLPIPDPPSFPAGTPWAAVASEGDPTDGDSVFLYYFGYPDAAAITLAPGDTQSRSLVLLSTCDQQPPTCTPTLPTGNADNALRAVKNMLAVDLSWTAATLTPPDARLFVTTLPTELAETPTGIGDETVVATTAVQAASHTPLPADPLTLYHLLPVDSCGTTLYP